MLLFEILFSYTIFKQFFNILATQNQNHNQNWPFLTKDMNYFSFHSLALSGKNAGRGELPITFFVFARTVMLKHSYKTWDCYNPIGLCRKMIF
jgi:hypothetical protein